MKRRLYKCIKYESILEIEGWKYEGFVDNGNLRMSVQSPQKDTPNRLYKLFGVNKNNVQAFCNSSLYANDRGQFNDLYDCHPNLVSNLMPIEREQYFTMLIKSHGEQVVNSWTDKLLEQNLIEMRSELIYSGFGIICLSEEYDNVLMWAYYGANSGYMVEYDTNLLENYFLGPFPINYQESLSPIKSEDFEAPLTLLYQSTIKSNWWNHENEWRYLVRAGEEGKSSFVPVDGSKVNLDYQSSRLIPYELEAVKSVRLGNRFFTDTEMSITADSVQIKLIPSDHSIFRRTLLEFCISNEIPLLVAFRQNDLMNIEFENCEISQIDELNFNLKRLE